PATAPPSTTPPGDHAAPPKSEPERVETTPQAGFALVRVAAQTPAKPTAPAQQASAPTQARAYAAGDFPEPVEVKRWQGIALVLHEGQVNAQGRRLVPERVATNGPLLKYMALTVSWVELIGGSALVLGAMARMFALLGTCILGGAMWLTQLGPSLGAPGSLLGLFPNPHLEDPMLATTAWAPFLLQLLSMACCFALLLMGPGRLSADHWFWGEKPAGHDDLDAEDDDEEDED
ncbi:MAG: hypothetical protein KDA20_05770, partial [Phycisphaerales bacterium]|nr:hypothetical protein [Phycisphaerales bacterium]